MENLLPKPETPKLPDIVPEVVDVDANATNLDQIVDEVAANKPEAVKAEAKENEIGGNVPAKPADLLAETAKPAAAEKAETQAKTEVKAIVEKVPAVAAGGWQIQFIASKNKAAVEKFEEVLK